MSSKARSTELDRFRRGLIAEWPSSAALVIRSSIDSTNLDARRAFQELTRRGFEPHPSVFLAWRQTAGRGRVGRSWMSAPGDGLWASILMPVRDGSELDRLPLLLPVVVCRALSSLGIACRLKWPNDLLVDGRKLGGLLIEAVSSGSRPRAAILGVGVNYETPASDELAARAVGIRELLDEPPELDAVARALLPPLLEALDGGASADPSAWVTEYRELSVHRSGDSLICRTAGEQFAGEFLGFDDRGFLRLSTAGGERSVAAGDLIESA